MLTFDAVTTYAERHWDSHARRCVETFAEHWRGVVLKTYTDEMLEVMSAWLPDFKQRHRGLSTENYRMDAVRFSHKVAAIELAYLTGTSDVLIWIDADCVTHSDVDAEWLSGLLGDGHFGYLRREKKYPECGFLMMRRCREVSEWLSDLVQLYRTDELFELEEWHDSWAIEQVRKRSGMACVSLSGRFEHTGHPFVNGPLGSRMDHCKGKRKGGKSLASDIKGRRSEGYWQHG